MRGTNEIQAALATALEKMESLEPENVHFIENRVDDRTERILSPAFFRALNYWLWSLDQEGP